MSKKQDEISEARKTWESLSRNGTYIEASGKRSKIPAGELRRAVMRSVADEVSVENEMNVSRKDGPGF